MKNVLLLFLMVFLFACSEKEAEPHADGRAYHTSADPSASYYVVDRGAQDGGIWITMKRVGVNGDSYFKRLYDCENWQVRYIGSGISIEAMELSKEDEKMADIVPESIAGKVGKIACSR